MRQRFKKYFIPHEENNYCPHILHTKRAFFYAAVFILIKVIVVGFALSVPEQAMMSADTVVLEQSKLIQLVNNLRQQQGVPALVKSSLLNSSGNLKATDMANGQYFSHTSPDGKSLAYYLRQVGYNYQAAGENLAMGFKDADELIQAWANSPTHYQNLIDPDFSQVGLGVVSGLYDEIPTIYVTQHLGAPKVATPPPEPTQPAEQPPATQPPASQPSASEPPTSQPPVTQPSASQPPTSQPPASQPPTSQPPTSQPPASQPPTSQPPTSEPPASQPPTSQPLTSEPPASQPPVSELPASQPPTDNQPAAQPQTVAGQSVTEQTTLQAQPIRYDSSKSYLSWQETNQGIIITGLVYANGDLKNVSVEIKQYQIPLAYKNNNTYVGSISVNEKPRDFFKVILPGVVKMVGADDQVAKGYIYWENAKVFKPTPLEKYQLAKVRLAGLTGVFDFSKEIYMGFLIFFGIALLLKIFIEIRKQHYHIILQTCGLLSILVFLYLF